MMGKQKKPKTQNESADFLQLKENLRFIQAEVDIARRVKQSKKVAQLKLKMLILKLRYNAEQLNRTALAAQQLRPASPKKR